MSFWDRLWDFVGSIGDLLLNAVTAFANAGIQAIIQQGGMHLVDAAQTAVEAAQATGGSGPDKAVAAYNSVKTSMEEKSISVADSVIRFAIEAAVQQLKVDLAAQASQPKPE